MFGPRHRCRNTRVQCPAARQPLLLQQFADAYAARCPAPAFQARRASRLQWQGSALGTRTKWKLLVCLILVSYMLV